MFLADLHSNYHYKLNNRIYSFLNSVKCKLHKYIVLEIIFVFKILLYSIIITHLFSVTVTTI